MRPEVLSLRHLVVSRYENGLKLLPSKFILVIMDDIRAMPSQTIPNMRVYLRKRLSIDMKSVPLQS